MYPVGAYIDDIVFTVRLDLKYALYIVTGVMCEFRKVCINCDTLFLINTRYNFWKILTSPVFYLIFSKENVVNKKTVVFS